MNNINKLKNKLVGSVLSINTPQISKLEFEIINVDFYNDIWQIKILLKEYLFNFSINGEDEYIDVFEVPSHEIIFIHDYNIRQLLNSKLKHYGIDKINYEMIK